MLNDREFQQRLQRVEVLTQAAEALSDTSARNCVRELIRAVLDLHKAALTRMWKLITQSGDSVNHLSERLVEDPLVSSLLLLHELHPVGLEDRVCKAIDALRPALKGYGYAADILEATQERIWIGLRTDRDDPGFSTHLVTPIVEEAILAVAPDVQRIQIDQPVESGTSPGVHFSLPVLGH